MLSKTAHTTLWLYIHKDTRTCTFTRSFLVLTASLVWPFELGLASKTYGPKMSTIMFLPSRRDVSPRLRSGEMTFVPFLIKTFLQV